MSSQKILIFVLGVFFTVCISAEAKIQSVAKKLPAQTMLLLHCSDRSSQQQAFHEVPLGKLLAEPKMKELVVPFHQVISPFIAQANQILAAQGVKSLGELWSTLGGEAFLAVAGMSPKGPSAVVSLQLPQEEKQQFYEMLQRVISMNIPIPSQPVEIDGMPFLAFPVQPQMSIYMGLVDDRLTIATSEELVKAQKNGTENHLAGNDSFVKALESAPKTGLSLYVNLEALMQFPMLPPNAKNMMGMLGINTWKSLVVSWGAQQKNLRSTIAVYAPGHQNKGLLNQLLTSPLSSSPHLEYVPSEVGFYMQSTSPLTLKVSGFFPMLQNFVPPQVYKTYSEQLGIPALMSLVQELESEWSYFELDPEGGSLIPNGIHLQKIKNKDVFETKLSAMMTQWGFQKKVISFENRKIHYWQNKLGTGERYLKAAQFDVDPKLIYLLYPYRCYFYLNNNTIAYSDLVHSLKNYATHTSQKYDSLANHEDFKKRLASIGSHSTIAYRAKNENFAVGYRIILGLLQTVEGVARDAGIPIEMALLPQAKTVAKYLTSESFAYRNTPEGFALIVESGGVPSLRLLSGDPSLTQGSLGVVAVAGIGAAIAIPGFLRARISANESGAIANLRSISTVQSMFSSSNIVDQNKNGTGEFGLLGELTGTVVPRGGETPVNPSFLTGSLAPNSQGIATKAGYCFKIYLPKNTDSQEQYFVAYAWPEKAGETGMRVFAINQTGEVWACENENMYSGTGYFPEASAALDPAKEDLSGELGTNPGDGATWSPTW